MDLIHCVIIDDEKNSRDVIRTLIKEFIPRLKVVGEAHDVASGLRLLERTKPDLVFLDITMPDGSGFDLLEHAGSTDFTLVFVTAYDQYAIRAFDYAALLYLLKPIHVEDLERVVSRYQEQQTDHRLADKLRVARENQQEFKKIVLPLGSSYEFVEVASIVRCEASGSYTYFYLDDGRKILVSKSLSTFDKLLPNDLFFRIHKTHLIQFAHVKKYVKGKVSHVIMSDDSYVDVSTRKKDEFVEKLKLRFGFI